MSKVTLVQVPTLKGFKGAKFNCDHKKTLRYLQIYDFYQIVIYPFKIIIFFSSCNF